MLELIFVIALWVILVIQGCFTLIPIGNERSTVRRLPWVTFAIMALNVLIYYVTLPSTAEQERELSRARAELVTFVIRNREVLASPDVRQKLIRAGIITRAEAGEVEKEFKGPLQVEYESWLSGPRGAKLLEELEKRLMNFRAAAESSIWYRYGLAPNGQWELHQLVTSIFLHGSTLHLFSNLIFFFAVAFTLEDLWGRGIFLVFYMLSGVAACLPEIINPGPLPMIGASGAISATMGAFLVRLHSARIKVFWFTAPFAIPFLVFGKKPFGTIYVPAYLFLPFYFLSQVLSWWFIHKTGTISVVGYSVHVAGFLFGALFALLMKASKFEERYINPRIEAKVSFAAPSAITSALDLMDKGQLGAAEHQLRQYLSNHPNDVNAIMALIQVYQRMLDYDRLNEMYGRLINYHLSNGDKEAAVYAYDALLCSFPDDQMKPRIPARDWILICGYLREVGMDREAAVEYERLVNSCPEDPLALRACVEGGEAALSGRDPKRALSLFQRAEAMNPTGALASRVRLGLEKCKQRLDSHQGWQQKQPEELIRNRASG
jgi:membrane associated rhomboid family serine protease